MQTGITGARFGVFMCACAMSGARVTSAPPVIGGCQIFPADHIWNVRIDSLPVDGQSDAYIASIGAGTGMHPDFGTVYEGAPNGIPYIAVAPGQAPVVIHLGVYANQSDPGPYPVPPGAPIEGGPMATDDRHVLVVDSGSCKLYELFSAYPQPDGSWNAASGAIFDLNGYALRPQMWTSADAAGLPILPGLVRQDEVASGEITHALRFTANLTRHAYVWPARHYASSSTDPNRPPMGQRFRLKATFNIAPYPQEVRVILTALKRYGMFLADNGSDWYLSGAPSPMWSDDNLHTLHMVHGSDFEAVDESSLMIAVNSAQARAPGCGADLNGDGGVGTADLALLLGSWGPAESGAPADLNSDGSVGSADLGSLLGAWGACP